MTEKPKAVIFDFDGTLAELNIDFAMMAQHVEALARQMGYDAPWPEGYLLEAMAQVQLVLGNGFDQQARRIIRDIEVEAADRAELFSFTRPLLDHLGAMGIGRAVISRNCDVAIRRVFPDIDEKCEVFVPRELAPRPKPHPDHVVQALEALKVAPGDAWMVGDHPTDMQAGKAAGCGCVGVASGRTSPDDLIRAGADKVLPHSGAMLARPMLGLPSRGQYPVQG